MEIGDAPGAGNSNPPGNGGFGFAPNRSTSNTRSGSSGSYSADRPSSTSHTEPEGFAEDDEYEYDAYYTGTGYSTNEAAYIPDPSSEETLELEYEYDDG